MNQVRSVILAAAILDATSSAYASTADAWAELYAKAGAACLKAAPLNSAKLRGQPVDF